MSEQGHHFMTAESKKYDQLTEIYFTKKGETDYF